MQESIDALDRDALLRISTIVDLLDAGWRPGDAELENARYVEKWRIVPSHDGTPYTMIGLAWSLPVQAIAIAVPIFTIDRSARWARIWDEWVVIGDPLDNPPIFDVVAIRDAAAAWLHEALGRLYA